MAIELNVNKSNRKNQRQDVQAKKGRMDTTFFKSLILQRTAIKKESKQVRQKEAVRKQTYLRKQR